MNTQTNEILTKDTLAETEKQFGGKHWSQFNDTENMFALMNAISDNARKDEHLKLIGDTHFSMTWDEFKTLIAVHGFVKALVYDFKYKDNTDEAILYYHPQKGLVIFATSFGNKKTVNGGHLYGEIQANSEEDSKTVWRWISTGGCIDSEKLIFDTSHDVREGLFSKLETLESAGKFLNKWTDKNRFLWFVDYVEDDEPDYDYKKITQEKIERCPREFKDIIGR